MVNGGILSTEKVEKVLKSWSKYTTHEQDICSFLLLCQIYTPTGIKSNTNGTDPLLFDSFDDNVIINKCFIISVHIP